MACRSGSRSAGSCTGLPRSAPGRRPPSRAPPRGRGPAAGPRSTGRGDAAPRSCLEPGAPRGEAADRPGVELPEDGQLLRLQRAFRMDGQKLVVAAEVGGEEVTDEVHDAEPVRGADPPPAAQVALDIALGGG